MIATPPAIIPPQPLFSVAGSVVGSVVFSVADSVVGSVGCVTKPSVVLGALLSSAVTGKTKPYVLHAEANAIIAASRDQMLGATLYMVCVNAVTKQIEPGTSSCMMCKRQVINAGIERVIVRDTPTDFRIIPVQDWIESDDSLSGVFGY